jgi:zinc protease
MSENVLRSARIRAALMTVCGLALAVVGLPAVTAQNPQTVAPPKTAADNLPTGRALADKHIDAIGGLEAFKAIKSIRLRGTAEITAQNISGEFEAVQARPAKLIERITIPMIGVTEEGYDGKVGWSIDPQQGPSLLTGRELAEFADDAEFDSVLHPANRVRELTTVERTQFDGHPAFKVKAVLVSGMEQFEYYDVDSGLEIGWEGTRATSLGVLPVVMTLRDYKRFGSLMHATTSVLRQLGVDETLHLTSVEYNVVPGNAFDLPKTIKALIK